MKQIIIVVFGIAAIIVVVWAFYGVAEAAQVDPFKQQYHAFTYYADMPFRPGKTIVNDNRAELNQLLRKGWEVESTTAMTMRTNKKPRSCVLIILRRDKP